MACDWLLVDGSSLIFRAFYGTRDRPPGRGGQQANAIQGFLERLARLIDQRRPRRLAVADDEAWRPDWRVELIPTYKSHRVAEPVPPGLVPQLPVIRDLLEAMGDIAPLLLAVLGDAERGKAFYRDRFQPALAKLREIIDVNLPSWAHRDFDPDLATMTVCGMCLFIALHNRFGDSPTGEPTQIAPELISIIWDGLRARD